MTPGSPPYEPVAWSFVGLTAVAAILWPIFYALAQDRWDSSVAMCPSMNMCPPGVRPLLDEGQAFETATNVSWVATLGSASLSVTFFLLAWL